MSLISFLGAVELGLIYGLVGLAVFLSFRVLNFPDLTVDGSFPLGASVCAAAIVAGLDPFTATVLAILAGAVAGWVTAVLAVRFGILHLLASILVMIALFSINIRIMGRPNVALLGQTTLFTPFEGQAFLSFDLARILVELVVVAVITLLLARFLHSELGLSLRATGANPKMARAQGIDTSRQVLGGMALSNGLCALAGALFAQANGFADVTMGLGTIVVGLAAVIVGETLFRLKGILGALVACLLGSLLYRLVIAFALDVDMLGIQASDLNLVTALLVGFALLAPKLRARMRAAR
ncbi:MAG TPA: ABC transporter permease [Geminicoccus sp.]|uniref:ABC transporter permease n=1 Tax=Geminicoccus sp. TaxID=2024832 RepID=UPI002E327742|nr:ABC transporter permease [Geminicoccus sp.]HEX2526982.1 ABC transporter permease [Geminicoccus sp.]